MGKERDWKKEEENFKEIFLELNNLDYRRGYSKMSIEKLSKLYSRIDWALIDYNNISQNGSEIDKAKYNSYEKFFGKYLESRLLTIIVTLIERGHSHSENPLKEYMDSAWADKLKDKDYYNEIADIAIIKDLEDKDVTYHLLFPQEQKTSV